MLYQLGGKQVNCHDDCFIAENATVIGRTSIGQKSSVWFNAVIRADEEEILIGERSNIQDGCVLHADIGFPLIIGNDVTVGHMAMLHGCRIGDNTLIGIGSTILNDAHIGNNCLIGAHALLTEGMEIPDGSLVLGSPARVKRPLTAKEIISLAEAAEHYVDYARQFMQELEVQQ